jgi:hypothetical protein
VCFFWVWEILCIGFSFGSNVSPGKNPVCCFLPVHVLVCHGNFEAQKQGNCANPRLFISSNSMSSKALTRFHAWAKAKFCALGAP